MDDDLKLTFMPKIISLNFQNAFDQLSKNEKHFAYFLQKSCWDGAPIIFFQNSYESPAIFIMFQTFFSSFTPFDQVKRLIFENAK
jgi:dipeptidyl-peptidase-3